MVVSSKEKAVRFNEITNELLNSLEKSVGDEMILNSFLRGIRVVAIENNFVDIETKTREAYDVINASYAGIINRIVRNIIGSKNKARFFVVKNKAKTGAVLNHEAFKNISRKYRFSNYVEARFNEEVIKIARKTIDKNGFYSPFFITSKSGLGKTHLLHAIGNELTKQNTSCYYIEPNNFTRKIGNLSKRGGDAISRFIDKLYDYEVLLFDDIQNLGDRSVTLKVLLQILNLFNENDKQIIIASDKIPRELSGFEARFITRFSSGLTSIISQPSNDDLIKILKFKLKESNLFPEKWEREALQFIIRNNSQSIRSIEGAIKRISFYVEDVENIKYTYAVVSNIFRKLLIDPKELTPQRIINVVSDYYKVSKSDIVSKKRNAGIVIARHMAIWMVRKLLLFPLKKIGRLFGNRDHSTIMSSIKTMDKKIALNNVVKVAAEKIESKIKKIS